MAGKILMLAKMEMKPRMLLEDGKWEKVKMAAFVGATDEELAQFGIGLVDGEGHCWFWALALPHLLVTSWRGMQVLDRLERIDHGTICNAYYIGKRRADSELKRAVPALSKQLPEIIKLRDELLRTKIPDEELDRMLEICNSPDNNIDVAIWELEDEIKAGTIQETEKVRQAFEIDAAGRVRWAQNEARSKQALPRHQSFRRFCEDAKIQYLCDVPFGAYGFDWGHRNMETLDETIVFSGLQFGHAVWFACTENPERAQSFGQVGLPVIRLADERELVLEKAHYHDDQMWAGARLVKDDELTEWRLDELASMKPRMVGITYDAYDNPSSEDAERGYALIKKKGLSGRASQLLQKLRKC